MTAAGHLPAPVTRGQAVTSRVTESHPGRDSTDTVITVTNMTVLSAIIVIVKHLLHPVAVIDRAGVDERALSRSALLEFVILSSFVSLLSFNVRIYVDILIPIFGAKYIS